MNLPNESVIILDSPEMKRVMPKKGKGGKRKPVKRVSLGVRTPLKTVYERPCRRGLTGSRDVIPLTTKRKRARSTSSTPKITKKRRKSMRSENDNESVIILSDDDDIQAVPGAPGPSDMIPLVSPSPKRSKKSSIKSKPLKKTPPHMSKQQRLQKRKERRILLKNLKNKNPQDDDEELKILWSSEGIPESFARLPEDSLETNEGEKSKTKDKKSKDDESFYVDVVGDTSLHELERLDLNVEYPDKKDERKKNKKKNQEKKKGENTNELREIIIDGCNVAMAHANSRGFSEKGLQIVLDYFVARGHKVTIFIPQHKRSHTRQLLEVWNREGVVVFTPSRKVGNKCITPYDDRFILDYANKCQGIIISQDQFRDLWEEKPEWRETIEKRLLAPTFVGDYLMFPVDPLGQYGPNLEDFLRF